jgi:hypothetical protein
MKRTIIATTVIVVFSTTLACGALNLGNLIGGGQQYTTAGQLWSDVPPMDGLSPSQLTDIPLPIKLILRTVLGNLGRLNPQGQDQTTGNIDWIAFNSTGTPDDVKNFYTSDRMVASGWDQSDQSTCFSGSDQGAPDVGVICVFGKTKTATQTYLAIIASQDASTKQTTLFYLRLEQAVTPTP